MYEIFPDLKPFITKVMQKYFTPDGMVRKYIPLIIDIPPKFDLEVDFIILSIIVIPLQRTEFSFLEQMHFRAALLREINV